MDKKIITKFRVANEEGIAEIYRLTRILAFEKFQGLLPPEILETYITENFNQKTLVDEMNSLSNQWLVVYSAEEAVGYARITSKGKRPEVLLSKRAVRIADFGILKAFPQEALWQALIDKCKAVTKGYEAVWLNEYAESPVLDYFQQVGFTKQQELTELDELPLPAIYLIREA